MSPAGGCQNWDIGSGGIKTEFAFCRNEESPEWHPESTGMESGEACKENSVIFNSNCKQLIISHARLPDGPYIWGFPTIV